MEAPEAKWVSMVMDRLHAAEQRADDAVRRVSEVETQLRERLPCFAPGFIPNDAFFFDAGVRAGVPLKDLATRVATKFEDFTVALHEVGTCHVGPDAPSPIMYLYGVLWRPSEGSAAAVSQGLHACLGDALCHDRAGSVHPLRCPDICAAAIADGGDCVHRDADGNSAPPELDTLLDADFASEFEDDLRHFISNEHVTGAFSARAQMAVERIKDHLRLVDAAVIKDVMDDMDW